LNREVAIDINEEQQGTKGLNNVGHRGEKLIKKSCNFSGIFSLSAINLFFGNQ
jgi:hypothetical protein